jgi:hypothetical protein
MYSGTTFRIKSGRVMGVHQRIDRVARRRIEAFLPDGITFPTSSQILHFEGLNGPDGIKRKSPAKDEPWHYINPRNPEDTALVDMILEHIENMAQAIREENNERIAFEAAWMAHAITDGLTPAHHYPLEEKLIELRGGKSIESRTTTKEKLILPGITRVEQLKNNWEYWGIKGVMTTHLGFELGVAAAISGSRLSKHKLSQQDIDRLQQHGFRAEFMEVLAAVDEMQMYQEYGKKGWTANLAREARRELIPLIIRTVGLGWCQAVVRSDKIKV